MEVAQAEDARIEVSLLLNKVQHENVLVDLLSICHGLLKKDETVTSELNHQ